MQLHASRRAQIIAGVPTLFTTFSLNLKVAMRFAIADAFAHYHAGRSWNVGFCGDRVWRRQCRHTISYDFNIRADGAKGSKGLCRVDIVKLRRTVCEIYHEICASAQGVTPHAHPCIHGYGWRPWKKLLGYVNILQIWISRRVTLRAGDRTRSRTDSRTAFETRNWSPVFIPNRRSVQVNAYTHHL
eukprot:6200926-Pleurochrysis_carterae.AAC.1